MALDHDDRLRRQQLWLRVTAAASLTALMVLVTGFGMLARNAEEAEGEYAQRAALNQRVRQVRNVVIALADAEASQRGFLLTGKQSYLEPYAAATARLPDLLNELDLLAAEQPELEHHVRAVRDAARFKQTELAETIRLREAGQYESALAMVQTDAGQALMAQARDGLEAMLQRIDADRAAAAARIVATTQQSRRVAIGTVVSLVALLALLGLQLAMLALARRRYERALTESEKRHRDIVEDQEELISLSDESGTFTYLNPAYSRHFGRSTESMLGSSLYDFVEPRDRAAVREHLQALFERGGKTRNENRMVTLSGEEKWVAWTNRIQTDDEGRRQLHSVGRDVTQRRQAEEAMKEVISQMDFARKQLELQGATLRSIIEAIPAMVAVLDRDLRYRMVNTAFERWRQLDRADIIGRSVRELFGEAEHARSWPWAQRALAGETVSFEKDYPLASRHRHVSLSYLPLRLADGTVDGMIGVVHDVTEHREENLRLLALAERDTLTGLLNRAGFESFLKRQAEGPDASTLGLLYIDLDHFKPVNDSHGHAVGDEVLRQFALRLQSLVRPTDGVARLGGDEFGVVLPNIREQANANRIADQVIAATHEPFVVDDRVLHVGASVGVAVNAAPPNGCAGLVRRADSRLYAAKAAGRGRSA